MDIFWPCFVLHPRSVVLQSSHYCPSNHDDFHAQVCVPQGNTSALVIILVITKVYLQIREYEKAASSRHSNMSTSSDFAGSQITAESEDLGDNKIQIGRIVFNVGHVLGKGCEGTFVYK